jgi:hypothetical protein
LPTSLRPLDVKVMESSDMYFSIEL